jgi:NADPH-ferrihemoprotein reductase
MSRAMLMCRHFFAAGVIRPTSAQWGRRFLSTQPVRILYGSQGGTAQVFGMQIQQELEEHSDREPPELLAINEANSFDEVLQKDALNVILVSVTGVGEPPDNAREFYEHIMSQDDGQQLSPDIQYTVFGLGNSIAHPNHYNVIGKNIDSKLAGLGAQRVYPLGLGDDGDCLEDDFDTWMDGLLKYAVQGKTSDLNEVAAEVSKPSPNSPSEAKISLQSQAQREPLQLESPVDFPVIRETIPHVEFYQEGVEELTVVANQALSTTGGEQGLRELQIQLLSGSSYETGDHAIIYPRNSSCMVDSFLNLYPEHDASSIIADGGPGYPHPTGITIFETLSHCVDLGAAPPPSLSRFLLRRNDIDYRQDIALPRRTVLELIHEAGTASVPALQDLLHLLPKMQPRYYSIASSPKAHPDKVFITYRPVKYLSSTGHLREGTCTSHMVSLAAGSQLCVAVRSNPTFRLPEDLAVPIICVAGGCGIAPIRAFLEDRLASINSEAAVSYGESLLFLGFRSPSDEVYRDMVNESLSKEAITTAHISYSGGCTSADQTCQLVSETVRGHGDIVLDWIENKGACIYLCGGARSFGAAMEAELVTILEMKMSTEDATKRLQELIAEGRLCEDLAD